MTHTFNIEIKKMASRKPEDMPKPKACSKCGEGPETVAFKWRSDRLTWRNECNTCYNAKGYSEASRARRREEDNEGYLKQNAATHLAWAHRHPAYMKEQHRLCATVPARKMKTILTSAKQRGIDVSIDDVVEMEAKLSLECEYCGFVPHDRESLNGLDRVSSELGYTSVNTVPCCATCNAMKGPLDTDVFITNVRNICTFSECNITVTGDAPRVKMAPFSRRAELRDAPKKEKNDFLTRDEKLELWISPCYLCGQSSSFGIDRVDASGDYTMDNSKSCCTDCNYMKKDLGLDDFKMHVAHIDERTKVWTLGDVIDKPFKICGGKTRQAVAALDSKNVRIIFPSGCTAGAMLGVTHNKVLKSIQNGTKCKGYVWMRATAREFRNQATDTGAGRRIRRFLNGV